MLLVDTQIKEIWMDTHTLFAPVWCHGRAGALTPIHSILPGLLMVQMYEGAHMATSPSHGSITIWNVTMLATFSLIENVYRRFSNSPTTEAASTQTSPGFLPWTKTSSTDWPRKHAFSSRSVRSRACGILLCCTPLCCRCRPTCLLASTSCSMQLHASSASASKCAITGFVCTQAVSRLGNLECHLAVCHAQTKGTRPRWTCTST